MHLVFNTCLPFDDAYALEHYTNEMGMWVCFDHIDIYMDTTKWLRIGHGYHTTCIEDMYIPLLAYSCVCVVVPGLRTESPLLGLDRM